MNFSDLPIAQSRIARVLTSGGFDELAKRLARKAYRATGASALDFPLRREDITDSSSVDRSAPPVYWTPAPAMTIGWICAPPGPGSGGHTTMFRMIEALEEVGHTCVLYLYDPHGVDLAKYTAIVRRHWSHVHAEVRDIDDGIRGTDAVVATSWQTAHVLGSRPTAPGTRFYFVQDYEPYFYPRGSEYALAEDTYRFGFEILALGSMVHDEILSNTGARSTLIPFGCDTDVYRLTRTSARHGVAFYSRPDTARRGSLLAGLALDLFHAQRPDVTIHLIGTRPPTMSAPAVEHAHLEPRELAELYNTTVCGIGMSFTNISLVVAEMLACGTIPVINDSAMARADLTHPSVSWVAPTPAAIAERLCELMDSSPDVVQSRAAAAAAGHRGWAGSTQSLVRAVDIGVRMTPPPNTLSRTEESAW